MKSLRLKSPFLLGLGIVAACIIGVSVLRAATTDNVFGYAWSPNIGWIKLNNCTDPTTPSTCTDSDYGVSVVSSAPGTVSGYAWSPNIGWITFNNSGCPTDALPDCTAGAAADWDHPNGDGSVNIKGWARACSVYVVGCSGAENPDSMLGGWDGYIALDVATSGGPEGEDWGVVINPNHTITGFAWGSDVIGVIGMTNASVTFVAHDTSTDFNAPSTGIGDNGAYCAVNNPRFSWKSQETSCTLTRDDGTDVTLLGTSQAQGGGLESDGKYYYTPNLPVTGTSSTYTLQCSTNTPVQVVINECYPDYVVSVNPSSYTLTDGTGAYAGKKVAIYTVSVVANGAFTSPVALSIQSSPSNMPASTSYNFDTTTLTYSGGGYGSAQLTIAIDPGDLTQTTTYTPIIIQGSGSGIVRTAAVSVGAVKKNQPVYTEF
jgi:hypothetical protein